MSIVIRLDRLLVERKMTLTDLSTRVGITIANLSILKTGKAKAIRLSTLEAICRELQCTPGDLLEYCPDDSEAKDR
jgi:putative transcriptional regulator